LFWFIFYLQNRIKHQVEVPKPDQDTAQLCLVGDLSRDRSDRRVARRFINR